MKQQVTVSYHKLPQVTLSSSGFTLIEILVTILIISVLTGIGTLVYTSAQRSGRDSKRQADLKRVQNALELYYADEHSYPAEGDCSGTWASLDDLGPYLVSGVGGKKYTEEIPEDPDRDPSVLYFYCAFDGCYCLSAGMDRSGNARSDGECGPSGSYTSTHGASGYYLMCP